MSNGENHQIELGDVTQTPINKTKRASTIMLSDLNPELAAKLKKFDTSNDGKLELEEALHGLLSLHKQSSNYKRLIWLFIPIILVIVFASFATTIWAIKVTKDMKTSTGILTDVSGEPVRTVVSTVHDNMFTALFSSDFQGIDHLQIHSAKLEVSSIHQVWSANDVIAVYIDTKLLQLRINKTFDFDIQITKGFETNELALSLQSTVEQQLLAVQEEVLSIVLKPEDYLQMRTGNISTSQKLTWLNTGALALQALDFYSIVALQNMSAATNTLPKRYTLSNGVVVPPSTSTPGFGARTIRYAVLNDIAYMNCILQSDKTCTNSINPAYKVGICKRNKKLVYSWSGVSYQLVDTCPTPVPTNKVYLQENHLITATGPAEIWKGITGIASWESNVNVAYVVADHVNKEIIAVIRGAITPVPGVFSSDYVTTKAVAKYNWIQNLLILPYPYANVNGKPAMIHFGFYDMYNELKDGLYASIVELQTLYPRYKLILTGHDAGGAVATIAAVDLKMQKGIQASAVFTYGSPRAGDETFVSLYNDIMSKSTSVRVVYGRDIIAHFPPSNWVFKSVSQIWSHVATEYFVYANAFTVCAPTSISCSIQFSNQLSVAVNTISKQLSSTIDCVAGCSTSTTCYKTCLTNTFSSLTDVFVQTIAPMVTDHFSYQYIIYK